MSDERIDDGFTRVSHQERDPELFFRLLDMQAASPAIVALRAHAKSLLDPRPGGHYLDVGSGTGEVARSLADHVVPGGSVVGVDASPTMVAEARRRTPADHPASFAEGDAMNLAFDEQTFDGVHCERVLQHLPDPAGALQELIRVTKTGGHVCVTDTDWETAILGPLDPALDRRLRLGPALRFPSGLIGRRLYALMRRAGLLDVTVTAQSMIFTEWDEDAFVGPPLSMGLMSAVDLGLVTEAEAAEAIATLKEAAAEGTFFSSVTMFLVAGRKA